MIRVGCETCGDVQLAAEQITLRICRQNNDSEYRFLCPSCERIQVKRCVTRIGLLLVRYAVHVDWWDLPLELEERKDHPPITWDDVLDAHLELEQL